MGFHSVTFVNVHEYSLKEFQKFIDFKNLEKHFFFILKIYIFVKINDLSCVLSLECGTSVNNN